MPAFQYNPREDCQQAKHLRYHAELVTLLGSPVQHPAEMQPSSADLHQAPQGPLTFEDSPVILRSKDQGPALSVCPGDNV